MQIWLKWIITALIVIVCIASAHFIKRKLFKAICVVISSVVLVLSVCFKENDVYLGILVGISSLLSLYIATIVGYMHFKKRCPDKKFTVEVCFIAFVFLLSFVARLLFWVVSVEKNQFEIGSDGNLVAWIDRLFYALYSTIGGLTFEGLDDKFISHLYGIFYYGLSLYAGMVALSILTVQISYELFSILSINPNGKENVYLFTTVTEETYLLACSIANQQKDKKKEAPLIIFTGNEIEPFDHKNPLHMGIMRRGFYYWSYPKTKDKNKPKSVLKVLHLGKTNCTIALRANRDPRREFLFCKKWNGSRIHIFAMGLDKQEEGYEEKNSDIVFDEIRAILNEDKKYDSLEKTIVDFHILTNSNVNYRFYREKVESLVDEWLAKYSAWRKDKGSKYDPNSLWIERALADAETREKGKEKLVRFISECFQIHVLDDADLSADHLIEVYSDAKWKKYEKDHVPTPLCTGERSEIGIMVVGFGQVGQKSLNNLIVQLSDYGKDGPVQIHADVYDSEIRKNIGAYMFDHPLFHCQAEWFDAKERNDYEMKRKNLFFDWFLDGDLTEEKRNRLRQELDWKDYETSLGVPTVTFHDSECFGSELKELIETFYQGNYDHLVISLGSDIKNIALANYFISYFKRMADARYDIKRNGSKTIFVNVRDEKNAGKLEWNQKESAFPRYEGLSVFEFGCRESLFSHAFIIDNSKDKRYNFIYCSMDKKKDIEEKIMKKENVTIEEIRAVRKGFRDKINQIRDDSEYEAISLEKWFEVDSFLKESNASARRFSVNYRCSGQLGDDMTKEDILHLMKVEHLRWNRFHMCYGWTFMLKKDDKADRFFFRDSREHNCLIAFEANRKEWFVLPDDTKPNDVANVFLAEFAE